MAKGIRKASQCFTVVLEHQFGGMLLEDVFDSKCLIKSSGELNGYEDDTPELSSFDIVIRL